MPIRSLYIASDIPNMLAASSLAEALELEHYPVIYPQNVRLPIDRIIIELDKVTDLIAFIPGRFYVNNAITVAHCARKRIFLLRHSMHDSVLERGVPNFDLLPNPAWFTERTKHIRYRSIHDIIPSVFAALKEEE